MNYETLTKEELIGELEAARSRIVDLEARGPGTSKDVTERDRTEKALAERLEKYSTLVEHSRDGILIVQDGECKFTNRSLCRMTGYSEEDLLGADFWNYLEPASRDLVTERYRARMAGEPVPTTYESSVRCKDGTILDVEISGSVIEFRGRKADMGTVHDVTEERRVERELQRTAGRLDLLLRQSPAVIFSAKTSGDFAATFISENIVREFGYTQEEFLSRPEFWIEHVHPDDREGTLAKLDGILERGVHQHEYRFLHKNGSYRWVYDGSYVVSSDEGKPLEIIGYIIDITKRRRAEEQRNQERDRAQQYLDIAGVIFVAIDSDGVVTMINQKGREILGYEEKEIVGKNWFDHFIPKRLREAVLPVSEKLLRGEVEAAEYHENPVLTRSGEERTIAWHNSVIRDDDGNIMGHLSSGEDVTERIRTETDLAETTELLQTVFDHTPTLVAYLDSSFNFLRVNRAYAKADERHADFFPGKNHFDLYPHAENETIFQKVVDTGEPVFIFARPFEYPDAPERGVTYWDWSIVPIKRGDGKVTGLVLTLADITPRIRAEKALRESEEKYKSLVNQSLYGVVVSHGFPPEIVFANPAAEEITGYSLEELQAMTAERIFDQILLEDVGRLGESHAEILEKRKVATDRPLRIRRKDGAVRWIEIQPGVIEYGTGSAIQTTFTDITDRMLAQEALRVSEERFRALASCAPIGIFMTDAEGRNRYTNERLQRMSGLSEEDSQGFDWLRIVHPDDRYALRMQAREEPRSTAEFSAEFRIQPAGESIRWLSITSASVLSTDGKFMGRMGAIEDITERKESEETHLQLTTDLKDRVKELRCLYEVSRLTADLKNPIGKVFAGILSAIQTASRFAEITCVKIQFGGAEFQTKNCGTRVFGKLTTPLHVFEKPSGFLEVGTTDESPSTAEGPFTTEERELLEKLALEIGRYAELKGADEALRVSEERFRRFFENQPEYCYMISPDGTILDANKAARNRLGYSREEILALSLKDIYAPESRWKAGMLFQEWVETGSIRGEELEIVTRTGERRTVLLDASALEDPQSNVLHSISVQRDITDVRRLEREILEVGTREQRRISRDLHDGLGQDLTAIAILLKALAKKMQSMELPELPEIEKTVAMVNEAISQARALARGLDPIHIEKGGLVQALEDLASRVETDFGVSSRFECGGDVFAGDPEVNRQVYFIAREAVNNAVKHGEARAISVRLERADPEIRLTVRDDGSGLPEDYKNREGMGIEIMKYRANVIRGVFAVHRHPEGGTEAVLSFPG